LKVLNWERLSPKRALGKTDACEPVPGNVVRMVRRLSVAVEEPFPED